MMKTNAKKTIAALCALTMCAGLVGFVPVRTETVLTASAEEETEQKVSIDGNDILLDYAIVSNKNEVGEVTYHALADSITVYSTALDGNSEKTKLGAYEAWEVPNAAFNPTDAVPSKEDLHGYEAKDEISFEYDDKYVYLAEVTNHPYFHGESGWYQYEPKSGKWVGLAAVFRGGEVFSNEIPISAETFTMLDSGNLTNITITSSDGTVLNNVNNTQFKAGDVYFDLRYWLNATWTATYSTVEIYEKVTTNVSYTLTGKFAGTVPYVVDTTVNTATSKRDDNSEKVGTSDTGAAPVVSLEGQTPIDDNGKEISFVYDVTGHGAVDLICDGNIVETYTAQDFDNGFYTIPNYKKYGYYFLRMEKTEGSKDYLYFKFDNSIGKWVFRVDTEQTPTANLSFNLATLPFISSGFSLIYTDNGEYYGQGHYQFKEDMKDTFETLASWSKEDYLAGKAEYAEVPTNPDGSYYIYAFSSNGHTREAYWYRIIGIDCVPMNGVASMESWYPCRTHTRSGAGDEITVSGTDDDGNEISYTTTQTLNDDTLGLPNGDYKVVDNTSGLVEDVEVVNGKVVSETEEEDTLNLNKPVYTNLFTITALNGDVLGEGIMKNKAVSADDITVKIAGKLTAAGVYAHCTSKYGVINSVAEDAVTIENSYVGMGRENSFNKVLKEEAQDGDIDNDQDTSVLDIIKEQKYIMNQESLSFRDFVAADINRDGEVDIFDMGLLKRKILEKDKESATKEQ